MTFLNKFNEYLDKVNNELDTLFVCNDIPEKKVYDAVRYSLSAGGKRIRPVIALGFCEMLSGCERDALVLGTAIECIHTYSLIHDDLPCMDDDDLRRGKPTCHKAFDEATAVLAGDALLNFAFERMTDIKCFEKISSDNLLKAANYIGSCSGIKGMIGGQAVDMVLENSTSSDIEMLEYLHRKKTGALIRCSAAAGVFAANGSEEDLKAAEEFTLNLGLAFQIKDDILDVTSTTEVLGKNIGSDIENGKTTYVSLLGLEKAEELLREYTNKAISALSVYGERAEFLIGLSEYLLNRNN